MTVLAIERLINFEQYMMQGLWKDADSLLQLPCTTEETIKKIKRAMHKKSVKATIQSLQDMNPEDRKELDVWGESELR